MHSCTAVATLRRQHPPALRVRTLDGVAFLVSSGLGLAWLGLAVGLALIRSTLLLHLRCLMHAGVLLHCGSISCWQLVFCRLAPG